MNYPSQTFLARKYKFSAYNCKHDLSFNVIILVTSDPNTSYRLQQFCYLVHFTTKYYLSTITRINKINNKAFFNPTFLFFRFLYGCNALYMFIQKILVIVLSGLLNITVWCHPSLNFLCLLHKFHSHIYEFNYSNCISN